VSEGHRSRWSTARAIRRRMRRLFYAIIYCRIGCIQMTPGMRRLSCCSRQTPWRRPIPTPLRQPRNWSDSRPRSWARTSLTVRSGSW